MDFEEYVELQSKMFVQYYRSRPILLLNKEHADNDGNRIIMPASALDRLTYLHIEYPMLFQIQNPSTEQISHCGVLEFVADEGYIYIPSWLMAHLGLQEDDLVLMKNTSLPMGTFVKLQPHTMDFLSVSHPRDLLEYNFGKYACLTTGETITVTEGEKRYYLNVIEARPGDAIRTLETDCEVEFAQALDYKEPVAAIISQADEPQPPVRFTGVAMRMDGKPVEQQPPPPVPSPAASAGSSAIRAKRVLRFGPSVAASSMNEEDDDDTKEVKWFAGQKYSLED